MKQIQLFIIVFLLSSCAIGFPIGHNSVHDLLSAKYYYKTYTTKLKIDELQSNLVEYSRRCGYGLNNSWRTLERISPTEAMFIAQNNQILMFGANIKEVSEQTKIDLYTWGANEFPEHFLEALENGQCVTGSYRNNPVLMERMKQSR